MHTLSLSLKHTHKHACTQSLLFRSKQNLQKQNAFVQITGKAPTNFVTMLIPSGYNTLPLSFHAKVGGREGGRKGEREREREREVGGKREREKRERVKERKQGK